MLFTVILFLFLEISVEKSNLNEENVNSVPELGENNSKLLIILVDGFRWDYAIRDKTLKGFPKIAENGVRAEKVKPIFPANSYPNWYAISTGLYAENHGIIENRMYDRFRDEYFFMAPDKNASHSHWWNQTEPLWTNAVKQGVKTSMYLWDGCQVNISGVRPSLCYEYRDIYDPSAADKQTRSYIKNILDDFSDNKYRLSFLYYELVDHLGHYWGPTSDNVTKAVRQIDAILYDLFNEIIERNLDKTLNVVIVSDHGMTDLSTFKTIQFNESLVDFNDIQLMLGSGSGTAFITKPGKEDQILSQLSNIEGIKAYKKSEIPEQFHYKHNPMVLDILVKPDIGYAIEPPRIFDGRVQPIPQNVTTDYEPGGHGYDRDLDDMHGIMYGFGPAFKTNIISGQLETVDHYNLFCHLLGITSHPNNGTFDRIKTFLNK